MEKYKCKRCDKVFDNYISLRKHAGRLHKIKSENFFAEFYLNNIRPTCKCGCGEYTEFATDHYKDYKRGHISRIKNNWGHNQKAIDNSSKTRRLQFEVGERKVWNDGLTKETDERVANQGKMSTKENNPIRALKISKSLKGIPKSIEHNVKNSKHWQEYWSDPIHREEQRNRRMIWMKENDYTVDSKTERKFKISVLENLNIQYEPQFYVREIVSFYDFHIKNTNILIEIDGDFWHCNPNSQHALPKYKCQFKNLKKDTLKTRWALENNYILLRFWETDINSNLKEVVKKLLEYL
jgi:very-short-patch-repair endonuclease